MSKKKEPESIITPVSVTSMPMQLVAPIPILSPAQVDSSAPSKNELLNVKDISETTTVLLKKFGINNLDDLASVSSEGLAKKLEISPQKTKKWVENAKKLTGKP